MSDRDLDTLIAGRRQVVIVEPRQLYHNEKVGGSKLEARRRPRSLSTKQKAEAEVGSLTIMWGLMSIDNILVKLLYTVRVRARRSHCR
jgi:hypothetical protein